MGHLSIRKNFKKLCGLVSTMIVLNTLIGCSAETKKNEEPQVEETEKSIVQDTTNTEGEKPKNAGYYFDYYNISDGEIENRLSNHNMKYPNCLWSMDFIKMMLVKINGEYRIIPVFDVFNAENNTCMFYDLETESELFSIPHNYSETNENWMYVDIKPDELENRGKCLENVEIVGIGNALYEVFFLNQVLSEFKLRDGINYQLDPGFVLFQMYGTGSMTFAEKFLTTEELFRNYVQYVPVEHQISSAELGLHPTYPEENKYSDSWKLSKEEIASRIQLLGLPEGKTEYAMGQVDTLVFKDPNGNYKLMNVLLCNTEQANIREVYDLFSDKYLFTVKLGNNFNYDISSDRYSGIDTKRLINPIDFFNDCTICYFAGCREINTFVSNHIEEFSKRDNIQYKALCSPALYVLFPYGEYDIGEQRYTVEEYAGLYVRLPEEMIVTASELGF